MGEIFWFLRNGCSNLIPIPNCFIGGEEKKEVKLGWLKFGNNYIWRRKGKTWNFFYYESTEQNLNDCVKNQNSNLGSFFPSQYSDYMYEEGYKSLLFERINIYFLTNAKEVLKRQKYLWTTEIVQIFPVPPSTLLPSIFFIQNYLLKKMFCIFTNL